jgi:hypothetical protein
MDKSVSINAFNRGKPFYPLIVNYLVLLIGFKDLAAQGVIKELNELTFVNQSINLDEVIKINLNKHSLSEIGKMELQQKLAEVKDGISKILGPLELKSEFQNNNVTVKIDEIANDLANNALYLIQYTILSASSLFILAHETSKDKPWHDRGPLWEFLRHCRNAAAHGGLFTFKGDEPKRLAEWGRFRIEATLQGTPLFKDKGGKGLLSPGDPIRLLWDIEQNYPSMSA